MKDESKNCIASGFDALQFFLTAVPITTIIAAYFAMNDEGFGALRPFLDEKNGMGGGRNH